MAKVRSTKHEYKSAERYKANIEQRPGESDLAYYTRLAKQADQRLVRLEKLANEPGFENVKKYAYAAAMRDIESYGGAGKKMRFNTKPPKAPQLFREKIMDMRRFLSAPTSSKAGIVETYGKRAESINKKYGTNFTWQDLADFFQSGDADKLFKEYGSKTVMRAIGVIQYTQEQVSDHLNGNQNLHLDGIPKDVAKEIMSSPKFQNTSLRKSMTKEERAKIRDTLRR